ncbi:UDP-glucose--hexose-1-phosphate uridylyltransferase [Labilibacter sediminis]|nr:UDP-glucose--hexose-1-phosphate uridylyltransferase [Labilibacter sediminis]
MKLINSDSPHIRKNPLTDEWVLVSPHRAQRPWQGQVEKIQEEKRPEYDKTCYLCPGNKRAGGKVNPNYTGAYSFVNDFSALLSDTPFAANLEDPLFNTINVNGICKVICFSPQHDLTIPEMELEDIKKVVDLWQNEYEILETIPGINYVQIFENKGSIMGCSNPHPHGQIWSSSHIPTEVQKESASQKLYFNMHGETLLSAYLSRELDSSERIVRQNNHFVALVPYWAVWPFEVMIISRKAHQNISGMNDEEKTSLADIYKQVTIMYDNLFEVSFAYSAGIHQSPSDCNDHPYWHFHMHFYPPLLRSATVKKFMVGYELLAESQRDITPEQSAERLRNLPKVHYKCQKN